MIKFGTIGGGVMGKFKEKFWERGRDKRPDVL